MDEIVELWGNCAPALRESVSDAVWQMWLSKVSPVDISGDMLTLSVPNTIIRSKVNDRFISLLRDAASATCC